MLIDRNVTPFVVLGDDSILVALEKISANRCGAVCCVDEGGRLQGILTDGDFRRWVVTQSRIDLQQPVMSVANGLYEFAREDDAPTDIVAKFSDRVDFLPIVDVRGRLRAIARAYPVAIQIGPFEVREDGRVLIIAEIGINHNGSLDLAKRLVDEAKSAGADCVKFQLRDMNALYRGGGDQDDISADIGTQYTVALLTKFSLRAPELFGVFDHCVEQDILPLCTPWDVPSVRALEEYGVVAFKVASADLTNHELLHAIADPGKPVLLSTGMSTEAEIRESVDLLTARGVPLIPLHCNSTYPAPFSSLNLRYIERLRGLTGGPVGYSSHDRGYTGVLAAVALGARVVEKHFTLDMTSEGNDHRVSLEPAEFAAMVAGIREVEEALGSSSDRKLGQGEMMNRVTLAKSIVALRRIPLGEAISAESLEVKSPGRGLQPNRLRDLIGTVARRTYESGDVFFASDLAEGQISPRHYRFRRPFGIPVRYHDFRQLAPATNPSFLEFHLTYKDLDLDVEQFFDRPLPYGLVVHSPDLFRGDHLLNLAAEDEEYRTRSRRELQRSIDVARTLGKYFVSDGRPIRVVVSVGGFTRDRPLPMSERERLYDRVEDELALLDDTGIEVLPQTLPPFPWYFGGQLFCNLFVDAEDTATFCEQYERRICLDVSHSQMAATNSRRSFTKFVEVLAPVAGHLHIADATGGDGEGVQIAEGDIDFPALAKTLDSLCPDSSFIPEIWQGHQDGGRGFWVALERLERWF